MNRAITQMTKDLAPATLAQGTAFHDVITRKLTTQEAAALSAKLTEVRQFLLATPFTGKRETYTFVGVLAPRKLGR